MEGEVARLSRMRDTVEGDGGGEGLSIPLPRQTLLMVNDESCPSAVKTTLGRSAGKSSTTGLAGRWSSAGTVFGCLLVFLPLALI